MIKEFLARLGTYLVYKFSIVDKGPTWTTYSYLYKLPPKTKRDTKKAMLNAWYVNEEAHLKQKDLAYLQKGLISPFTQGKN